jgi:hypothetical protein
LDPAGIFQITNAVKPLLRIFNIEFLGDAPYVESANTPEADQKRLLKPHLTRQLFFAGYWKLARIDHPGVIVQ